MRRAAAVLLLAAPPALADGIAADPERALREA